MTGPVEVLVDASDLAAVLDPSRQPLWPSKAPAAAVARLRCALNEPCVPADPPPPPVLDWERLAGLIDSWSTAAPARSLAVQDQMGAWLRDRFAGVGVDLTAAGDLHRFLSTLVRITAVAGHLADADEMTQADAEVIGGFTMWLGSVAVQWLPAEARP